MKTLKINLPANTITLRQPHDKEIARVLNAYYRQEVKVRILENMKDTKIEIIQAFQSMSWNLFTMEVYYLKRNKQKKSNSAVLYSTNTLLGFILSHSTLLIHLH